MAQQARDAAFVAQLCQSTCRDRATLLLILGGYVITSRQKAEIKRLYATEKWKKGSIAKQLGLHHQTVVKVLEGTQEGGHARRVSKIDQFIPFISEVLEKYPSVTASRIQQMIAKRGYKGSIYTLRRAFVVDHLKARIFVYLPRLWAKRKPALMRAYWLPKLTGGFS